MGDGGAGGGADAGEGEVLGGAGVLAAVVGAEHDVDTAGGAAAAYWWSGRSPFGDRLDLAVVRDAVEAAWFPWVAALVGVVIWRLAATGQLDLQGEDDPAFIGLVDSFADQAHPAVARLRGLVNQRGWTGWTQVGKREP